MEARLAAITAESDAKAKGDQYRAVLEDIIASGQQDQAIAFIDHVLSDSVPLLLSRQLLSLLASSISRLPSDCQEDVARHALDRLQPRAVSHEEQITALREQLALVYERRELWSQAAQALAGIDLDSGVRLLDGEYRLEKNVRIARLYLEDDDPVAAETYIKKASSLVAAIKNEALELQYRTCYARILDSKRRFLEAGTRYYELSLAGGGGPSRPRVSAFAAGLAPHQLATLPDGSTVLDRAVMEHNLESVSKLYTSIKASREIEELGRLLGVTPKAAEKAAARMILENRLSATLDQVSDLVRFGGGPDASSARDAALRSACLAADKLVMLMAARGLCAAPTS
ncbi:COP9 signalosome complex subunit 4 [Auxenochlorella protothecoides]|uniref:COP9 signalosome complex subunit 4 n=1 Tax=Auxenochlorella protothecoides TaxID=3075 RepID=A0A087STV3_AUXPR|nr:COP9 signalosome complex subunit 4 [Auxenochlorella protothecoides]KFM29157.1 COP9 signalosome complex subunit 4 [Auxenochlorella protothecoides]